VSLAQTGICRVCLSWRSWPNPSQSLAGSGPGRLILTVAFAHRRTARQHRFPSVTGAIFARCASAAPQFSPQNIFHLQNPRAAKFPWGHVALIDMGRWVHTKFASMYCAPMDRRFAAQQR
jgi:hypothetical protein